jgi:hypothetical protein
MDDVTHGRDGALAVAEQHGDARAEQGLQGIAALGAYDIAGMQKVDRA